MARRTVFENFHLGVVGLKQQDGSDVFMLEFEDPDSKEVFAFPLDERGKTGLVNALTGKRIERASAEALSNLPQHPPGR